MAAVERPPPPRPAVAPVVARDMVDYLLFMFMLVYEEK
jgi:hypothetical protein